MTDSSLLLTAQITDAERQMLKRIAKSRGMTLSGLVGQIVRNEIRNSGLSSEDPEAMPDGFSLYGSTGDIKGNAVL